VTKFIKATMQTHNAQLILDTQMRMHDASRKKTRTH